MKLLLDENISYRVAKRLSDIFEIAHVNQFNLSQSKDTEIWNFAKSKEYIIVTCDSDFNDFSVIKGFPPKVIWLRIGNTSTNNIVTLLKGKKHLIKAFHADEKNGIFIIESD
mgnify:CR=1 FL=1